MTKKDWNVIREDEELEQAIMKLMQTYPQQQQEQQMQGQEQQINQMLMGGQ